METIQTNFIAVVEVSHIKLSDIRKPKKEEEK